MSGITLQTTMVGFDHALRAIDALGAFHLIELADDIGVLIENSTKRRIANEKATPDGEAWADWSDSYAASRKSGHSLLQGEGDLLDSIQSYTSGTDIEVGTNLVYGAIQHFGGAEVGRPGHPAREYLGLSDLDRDDITELATDRLTELVQ